MAAAAEAPETRRDDPALSIDVDPYAELPRIVYVPDDEDEELQSQADEDDGFPQLADDEHEPMPPPLALPALVEAN